MGDNDDDPARVFDLCVSARPCAAFCLPDRVSLVFFARDAFEG